MLRQLVLTVGVAAFSIVPNAQAQSADDYWPEWRGPRATGVAPNGDPPITWSETKNIKWKAELPGHGSSTPVIWGDKIFFLTAIETDRKAEVAEEAPQEEEEGRSGRRRRGMGGRKPTNIHEFVVVCLDRKTGEALWEEIACEALPHEGHHPDHGFASYSPATDGKHVWASFGSRGLYCYDVDGKQKWAVELDQMKTAATFGEGASPVIAGDALIVVQDHEGDSSIRAFDKLTGKLIWEKSRDEKTTWATPLALEVDGRLEVITNATNFVRSYDAKTGDVIWQCSGQTRNVIPCPVSGFGMVFCTSGFRGSALLAIKLGGEGDLTGTDAIAWSVDEATPYTPSPLLYEDKIYVLTSNNAIVSCYQAETGEENFVEEKLEGLRGIYASPVGAAGRVYFASREGVVKVIKLSKEYEELATNTLDDRFDASPAIIGKELYLKGMKNFYCIVEMEDV